MSVNRTCAISSWISFLTSAAIWIHMEMPVAAILSSRLPRVECEANPSRIVLYRNDILPISIQSLLTKTPIADTIQKSHDSAMNSNRASRFKYWIGILLAVLILVASAAWGTHPRLADKVNSAFRLDALANDTTPDIPFSCGTLAYITNSDSNNVSVIDTSTNTVLTTVAVGSFPGCGGHPAGTHLYVANFYDNNVSVIDTTTNSVLTSVAVGRGPEGVAVNPAGTRV